MITRKKETKILNPYLILLQYCSSLTLLLFLKEYILVLSSMQRDYNLQEDNKVDHGIATSVPAHTMPIQAKNVEKVISFTYFKAFCQSVING